MNYCYCWEGSRVDGCSVTTKRTNVDKRLRWIGIQCQWKQLKREGRINNARQRISQSVSRVIPPNDRPFLFLCMTNYEQIQVPDARLITLDQRAIASCWRAGDACPAIDRSLSSRSTKRSWWALAYQVTTIHHRVLINSISLSTCERCADAWHATVVLLVVGSNLRLYDSRVVGFSWEKCLKKRRRFYYCHTSQITKTQTCMRITHPRVYKCTLWTVSLCRLANHATWLACTTTSLVQHICTRRRGVKKN